MFNLCFKLCVASSGKSSSTTEWVQVSTMCVLVFCHDTWLARRPNGKQSINSVTAPYANSERKILNMYILAIKTCTLQILLKDYMLFIFPVFPWWHLHQTGGEHRVCPCGARVKSQDPGVPGGAHLTAARSPQDPGSQQEDATAHQAVWNQRCSHQRDEDRYVN